MRKMILMAAAILLQQAGSRALRRRRSGFGLEQASRPAVAA